MIINGDREALLGYYIRIATAIGVTLDELVDGIEERKRLKAEQDIKIKGYYDSRVAAEDAEDKRMKRNGRLPTPRLPQFRIPT